MLGVWYMDGITYLQSALLSPSYPSDVHWKVVGTGDFNHDGNTDIVMQYQNATNVANGQLGVWYMNGITETNAVLLNPMYPDNTNLQVVATADFNSDLNTDLLFQNKSSQWGGALTMWYMNGTNKVGSSLTPTNPGSLNVCGPK
jgi:hypothetical protein